MKKIMTLALLASGMMLLNGCNQIEQIENMIRPETWVPQGGNAISIEEDGTITEIIQETLDASYYDAAELQNMITSEVADYNGEHGADSITVQTFAAEGNAVKLEMVYASGEDYARFNNVEFFNGSLIGAQLEGYLFDVSYKKVRDGIVKGSDVSGSEVIKEMDDQVLVVRAPLEVKVPGSVLYTSTNAEVLSSDIVNATGEQEKKEEEAGLVLPSNAVFKWEESSFEEQEAANRVYIIFEME